MRRLAVIASAKRLLSTSRTAAGFSESIRPLDLNDHGPISGLSLGADSLATLESMNYLYMWIIASTRQLGTYPKPFVGSMNATTSLT